MFKKLKYFTLLLPLFIVIGCGPSLVEKKPLPEINFNKMSEYSINLEDIPKPDKLERQYLNDNFDLVNDPKDASFVLLVPKEYAKIESLLDIIIVYKDIIYKQETLINTNIKIINAQREYLELERQKAQSYRDMWADSENAYRQEKWDRRNDSIVYKGLLSIISIGSTIAILSLL